MKKTAKKSKPAKKSTAKKGTKKTAKKPTVAAELGGVMREQLAALKVRKSRHAPGGVPHHKPAVTGPQLQLQGVPSPAAVVKGNPLVAFRMDDVVLTKFVTKHGSRNRAWEDLKKYIAKQVG